MPLYNYVCNDCLNAAETIKLSPLDEHELYEVIFETSHAMNPTDDELQFASECPRCGGHNTNKTYVGVQVYHYVRGYGYLDRAGCHRDMNVHKLVTIDEDTGRTTDPYAEMREPGEVEDLKLKLRRAGKHNPKPVHFVNRSEQSDMEQAVRRVVSTPTDSSDIIS